LQKSPGIHGSRRTQGVFSKHAYRLEPQTWQCKNGVLCPSGNPEKILEYLSSYVFRIAITDRRILEVRDGKVRFSWKDYRTGRFREMKLDKTTASTGNGKPK